MDATWDDIAEKWEANPDVIDYAEKAFQGLAAVASIAGWDVFDFGCGTGLLTEKISRQAKSVVSLDTSKNMIEVLAEKHLPNVTPIRGSLPDLLTSDPARYRSRFDLVVASSALAFVPDFEAELRHLHALLRDGGLIVQWDWQSSGESSGPGFTESRIIDAHTQAGFRSVSVTEAFTMGSPGDEAMVLMAVSRR